MKKIFFLLYASFFSVLLHAQNTFPSSGNVGIGTASPQVNLHSIGIDNSVSGFGNSTYNGGGRKAFSSIFGDSYGNGAAYSSGNPATFGGSAGGYFAGGHGGVYAGGAAGIIAIGGNGSTAGDFSATGGAGIFARGGFNGDGTRTYAGFFDDGNLIVNKGAIGIGTSSPFATLQATGASNQVPFKGNSTNYYGGGKNNSGEYGDAYGNGASYDPGNSNTYGGKTGAYFIGGNGGAYAGGAAGIIAIGGNAGVSGTDAWGGSGIYAKGGFNGNGTTRSFSGYFDAGDLIVNAGKIGIGTNSPAERLSVEGNINANGNIKTKKLIVTQSGWSDYVFDKDYALRSIDSLEKFILENKHLPEIPSAKEVAENGVNVGENQALLLKKIEELTLYIIEIKKELNTIRQGTGKQRKRK